MYLAYFDETKFEEQHPYFWFATLLIDSGPAIELEKTLEQIQYNFFGTSLLTVEYELHGKDIFHGKANCKRRKLRDRIELIKELGEVVIEKQLPLRLVNIHVEKHRKKYLRPIPEYKLGLTLMLERICDFLDAENRMGIVFGDYEKDEITQSILDFSQFKIKDSTPMYFGRSLRRLIDTIYFTHSHHSRFLQLVDIIAFLANRDENPRKKFTKWHDMEMVALWNKIKKETNIEIQVWP